MGGAPFCRAVGPATPCPSPFSFENGGSGPIRPGSAGFGPMRPDPRPNVTAAPRRGRVEGGLDREMVTRHDIGAAERAALRAQARAVDVAELHGDPDAVTRASAVYLQLREAAGLSVAGSKPVDAWDSLMAEMSRPGPGVIDTAND